MSVRYIVVPMYAPDVYETVKQAWGVCENDFFHKTLSPRLTALQVCDTLAGVITGIYEHCSTVLLCMNEGACLFIEMKGMLVCVCVCV